MRFRNIKTNEVVEAKSFTQLFAFSHNSNYVLVNGKEPVAEEANIEETTEEEIVVEVNEENEENEEPVAEEANIEETTEEVEVKKSPKKKK